MVAHNLLDHIGSDGSSPQERADRFGYHVPPQCAWIVVEVISAISDDPAGPLDWWLNQSPEVHGRVLTEPRWREMGVGYAVGGEYGTYWTVLVGCRPGVLPTVVLDGKTYAHEEHCGDPASVSTTLALGATTAEPGADVEVRWAGITSPTDRDWLGLYRPGDPDGTYLTWEYVSCGTQPLAPRPAGWCWLRMPSSLERGTYELRLHANDANDRIARSEPIAVNRARAGCQMLGWRLLSPTGERPAVDRRRSTRAWRRRRRRGSRRAASRLARAASRT
jgi:hypothetical protein